MEQNVEFIVHDAEVHCACVEIHAAVKAMSTCVESHQGSSVFLIVCNL